MNTIGGIFSSQWVEVLGWTLLHSLWQFLFVFAAVMLAMRCIPSQQSNVRYLVAMAGLLVIFLLSLGTIVRLSETATLEISEPVVTSLTNAITVGNLTEKSLSGFFRELNVVAEQNIPLIVSIWSIGAALFSLRLASGWWYVERIRRDAVQLGGDLGRRVQVLASSLKITQFIPVAESSIIQVPIVIGTLTPMILFPIGMCTGLSVEQLESIILHELIHIRRKDYLVNIAQSFLEAIYFYNPFVWIISGIIRREREHCCDDAVVRSSGNPLAYVRALATVEEVRLSKSGLAVSFAENRNQLLNRIKRLMEKSVSNYSGRERIVPVALLIIGLVCASWLTINHGSTKDNTAKDLTAAYDTTGKGNSFRYYRKSIDDTNEANQHTESTTDLELKYELVHVQKVDVLPVPPLTDLDIDTPLSLLADWPDLNLDVMVPQINLAPQPKLFPPAYFRLDTIPSPNNWDEFSKEFQRNFADKFGDFYKDHRKEVEGMMRELESKFGQQFNEQWVQTIEDLARNQERIARLHVDRIEIERELMDEHEESLQRFKHDMERFKEENRELEEHLKDAEEHIKMLQEQLQDELIKDGYLDKGEKINRIEVTEERIKINGTKIKPEHEKKYRMLIDKYSTEPADVLKSRSRVVVPGRME